MPRDQKIGLALGILLVGAVAAFFFRHDPMPSPVLPTLKSAAELDRHIAAQDRAPYLEADGPAVRQPAPVITDAIGPDEVPEPQDGAGLVPDPIVGGDELTMDADPGLAAPAAEAPAPPAEHLVQRGETLSSIAAKYLGNANRYEEIYQANTDRLRNPNDMRPGMTLRLPSDNTVANQPPRRQEPEPTPAEPDRGGTPPSGTIARSEPPLSASTGPKRFVPYRRSPLANSDGTEPALDADPKAAAKRRMTLNPPRDGSVIR